MIEQALSVVNEFLFKAKRELDREPANESFEAPSRQSNVRIPSPGKSYACRKTQQAALHEAARQCERKVLAHAGKDEWEKAKKVLGGIG